MSFDYENHQSEMRRNHGKMIGAIEFLKDNNDGVYLETAIQSLIEALEEYKLLSKAFAKSLEEK